MRQLVTVSYQVATYSGKIIVNANSDDENEYIIAKAKSAVRRNSGGSLPFGYESWKITKREDIF